MKSFTEAPAENFVPTRKPLYPDEPRTLNEMFLQSARKHNKPDLLNYKRGGKWHSISSEEFERRAKNIALGLYSIGIRPRERVAILSENCPEWTLADAGSLFCGAMDVPIYSTQAPAQVQYILNDSGARRLFIQNRAAYERVREAIQECVSLEGVIFFDPAGTSSSESSSLAELEEKGERMLRERPELADQLARFASPEDLATIIYTSGTTGEPKGVMLTHSNLVTNLIDSSGHLSFSENDVVLSVLPLSHVFERLGMYMYLYHGMSVYYTESLEKIGDNMREIRPTLMLGVPRLFEKIYARVKQKAAEAGRVKLGLFTWAVQVAKEYALLSLSKRPIPAILRLKHRVASKLVFEKWRQALGGRIRLFVSGGAALSDEIAYIFNGVGFPIVQGYGLTETSPVVSAGTLEENRVGTVGKPIMNVEVRIASDGEIEVRGPNIMKGYYKKPEETRRVLSEAGWFKTGDIGTLDEDGFLRITDRKKELFKTSGGKYIAPQPIEQMIKGSRFVSQVVLIGAGRKFPSALIVPDWEQIRSYAQLKGIEMRSPSEMCRNERILDLFQRQVDSQTSGLAKFEKVKRIALLEKELTIDGGELTPTMKVKRRVVDEKYGDVIDRIYEEAEAGIHDTTDERIV